MNKDSPAEPVRSPMFLSYFQMASQEQNHLVQKKRKQNYLGQERLNQLRSGYSQP